MALPDSLAWFVHNRPDDCAARPGMPKRLWHAAIIGPW
jgi:hypothetical protein